MIRWWPLLAAAGMAVSACSSGPVSLARSSSLHAAAGARLTIHSATPGARDITSPRGMAGSATLPQVTYPSVGITISARPPAAPAKFATDAVSPGAVLAAFEAQGHASLVGSALRTERPAIMLRTITELYPTAPRVRPHVSYTGWVIIYRHVQLVSYGPRPFPEHARGTFVAIMDAATGLWTKVFSF